jgi:hypothetical protein
MTWPEEYMADCQIDPAQIITLENLKRVALGPNDILVVMTDNKLSLENLKSIESAFLSVFPGRTILLLDGGLKLGVIEPIV